MRSPTKQTHGSETRLKFDLKFAFGVGQLAEGLKNGAFGTFLIFFYNQVLGVSGTLAGLAVGTAILVDAVTDPLAGSLSDHWHSRRGRRHPFMYASALPLAVCFFFLFTPMVESELGLFVWLVVFTNLTRTAMTLYHVPHIALGAEMTDDFAERSTLVSFRTFFGTFGSLAATVIGFLIFFRASDAFENGQLDATAYAPFALTLAVIMTITIWWSAWGTRRVIPDLPMAPAGPKLGALRILVRTFTDLWGALHQVSFRWLFMGVLVIYMMSGVDGALNIYMYTYFWEFTGNEILILAPIYPLGIMVGALFATPLQARFGKRVWLMFGASSWSLLQILPVVARLADSFPENGDPVLLPLLVGIRAIQGLCTVQALIAWGSSVADAVDEHELTSQKRQEGIFFAASSFASKASSGLGNIIAGFGLDLIAWPRGPGIRTAADVPAEALFKLGLLYGPIVAGFGIAAVWCFSNYRLTRTRHAEILAKLREQREG